MCKRDIVLVVDMSNSIEQSNFDNKVKPFLVELVSSAAINIDRDHGAQISMVVFSDSNRDRDARIGRRADKTKVFFRWNKYTTKQSLVDVIKKKMLWNNLHGQYTYTAEGLRLVNAKVSKDG